ncbi:hypothetical protein HOY80DRAFT_382702 [Tuber brumale]|nr:hypothetical protein HOY80DRAFT_382702 [Tuber brumale]
MACILRLFPWSLLLVNRSYLVSFVRALPVCDLSYTSRAVASQPLSQYSSTVPVSYWDSPLPTPPTAGPLVSYPSFFRYRREINPDSPQPSSIYYGNLSLYLRKPYLYLDTIPYSQS